MALLHLCLLGGSDFQPLIVGSPGSGPNLSNNEVSDFELLPQLGLEMEELV